MKAKTILFSVITLFLLISGIGCEKEKEVVKESIQIKDFSYYGCKKEETTKSTRAVESEEYIEYKAIADGYLYLKHVNADFNCCPDTIKATISIEENNITIVESETGPKCNCICDYDLECNLGPLSFEKYTLIFSRDTREYLRFTINYSSSLYGKVIIPK